MTDDVESWDPKAEIGFYGDVQAGVRWPKPIEARLEQLLTTALRRHRVNKRELVAAILLGAPSDDASLMALVNRLREATVADAIQPPEGENVVRFQRQPRGRPNATRSGER